MARLRLPWLLTLGALLALPSACKDNSSSDKRASQVADRASKPSSPRTFRAGDESAAGRMLSALSAVKVPRLDEAPACAKYAQNMRSLLADTSHQLHRLRELGKTGMPIEELTRFAGWLDSRSTMMEQIGQAKALQESELGRVHRELTAAVTDLAFALGESYPGHGREPEPEIALRLDNAVGNFATSANALEAQCKRL